MGLTSTNSETPKPFAKISLIVAWILLILGGLGFVGNITVPGSEALAAFSLGGGILAFALVGLLSEISSHLADIRNKITK